MKVILWAGGRSHPLGAGRLTDRRTSHLRGERVFGRLGRSRLDVSPGMVVIRFCGGVVILIDDRDRAESVSPSPRRPPEASA